MPVVLNEGWRRSKFHSRQTGTLVSPSSRALRRNRASCLRGPTAIPAPHANRRPRGRRAFTSTLRRAAGRRAGAIALGRTLVSIPAVGFPWARSSHARRSQETLTTTCRSIGRRGRSGRRRDLPSMHLASADALRGLPPPKERPICSDALITPAAEIDSARTAVDTQLALYEVLAGRIAYPSDTKLPSALEDFVRTPRLVTCTFSRRAGAQVRSGTARGKHQGPRFRGAIVVAGRARSRPEVCRCYAALYLALR